MTGLNKYTEHLENRRCILCGSADTSLISSRMKSGPQLMTVICKVCSLVYTNPIPSQEMYYSFYRNDYEKYYGQSTASKPSGLAEPAVFSVLKKFITISLADYLEIGPGRGLTLFHAQKLFKSVKGVEPSVEFTRMLVDDYRLNVINNTFEGFIADRHDTVDVVGMFHVLEHIYDPCKGLMSIREILNDNGLVVIEVPNILKPFRNLDTYFLRFVHLYNFSPLSLKKLLTKCGFEVLYEDDGGNAWSAPQNITMIARKSSRIPESLPEGFPNAAEVVEVLKQYRLEYNSSLRYKWFFFDKTRTPLKFLKRVRKRIKFFLTGSVGVKS